MASDIRKTIHYRRSSRRSIVFALFERHISMENPLRDVNEVVNLVCAAETADAQKAAVMKCVRAHFNVRDPDFLATYLIQPELTGITPETRASSIHCARCSLVLTRATLSSVSYSKYAPLGLNLAIFLRHVSAPARWYRVMSPRLKIEVKNATYNESTRELFVEVVQVFHIFLSPLRGVPSRSVCLYPSYYLTIH